VRRSALLVTVALAGCWSPAPRASVPRSDRYTAVGQRPTNAERATPPGGLDDQAIALGSAAPTASARDTSGATWSVAAALAARPRVVVVFYRGDWCAFCRAQLAELAGQAPAFAERNAAVVAISVDSVETSTHLAEGLQLGFPLVSDPGHRLIDGFGVFDGETEIAWPAVFIVERNGRGDEVVWRWLADTFRQRVATADILKAIDALPSI